jgi:LysM repeat protein
VEPKEAPRVSGDTLSEIAERHDVTVAELMDWNDLDDPDRIFAGATLMVSPEDPQVASTAAAGTHVVTAGDTLSALAVRFGTSVATLVATNELSNPNRIYVGQSIVLSTTPPPTTTTAPPRTHVVVAGDTLGTIAAAYGVKTGVLAADNAISNPDLIVIGMVLTIGEAAPRPSTPTTTTTTTAAPAPRAEPADDLLLAPTFTHWAAVYHVPQDLLEAIAWKESTWTPDAVGPGGHLGITQLSPATVELIEGGLLGRDMDPLDPDDGIQMGARFLRYLLDRTDSEREAAAAWVQGLRSVQTDGVSTAGGRYADSIDEIRRQRG